MLIPSRAYKADKDWNLSFDGTNDEVALTGMQSEISGLSALTIMFWARPAVFSQWLGYFSCRATSPSYIPAIEILMPGGAFSHRFGLFFRLTTPTVDAYGQNITNIMTANTWGHIAMVFDGSGVSNAARLKGYHNGNALTLSFVGTIPATTPTISVVPRLGRLQGWAGYFYSGRQANFMAWNQALTQKEIQYYMNRYLTGREPGLIAYYPFLDKTGTTLKDWSNNKLNATITGATWQRGI